MLVVPLLLWRLSVAAPLPGCALQAEIAGPPSIIANTEFSLKVTISNTGKQGCRFVRYWKWARNRMFLELENSHGHVQESKPALWDIDKAYTCFYVKPLDVGDSYSFNIRVNGEIGTLSLPIPLPGSHRLRWRYTGDSNNVKVCPVGNVATWTGDLRSNDISTVVEESSRR